MILVELVAVVALLAPATAERAPPLAPPIPAGLRPVLTMGGYRYVGGRVTTNGPTYAARKDRRHVRLAFRVRSPTKLLLDLSTNDAQRRAMERNLSRGLGKPVELVRGDTWARFVVLTLLVK